MTVTMIADTPAKMVDEDAIAKMVNDAHITSRRIALVERFCTGAAGCWCPACVGDDCDGMDAGYLAHCVDHDSCPPHEEVTAQHEREHELGIAHQK